MNVNKEETIAIAIVVNHKQQFLITRRKEGQHLAGKWEFPGGKVESKETIVSAMVRELKEEVGFGATQFTELKKVVMAPSYFNGEMTLFMAQDLYPESLIGDEPEPLEVIKWPLNKADELLARDDFQEARSISALLWVLKNHKK